MILIEKNLRDRIRANELHADLADQPFPWPDATQVYGAWAAACQDELRGQGARYHTLADQTGRIVFGAKAVA
jgi:hypothetical protein